MKKPTNKQKQELKRVAAMPDDQIDTSDIPEIKDLCGGLRGRFGKPETRAISIRLSQIDLGYARVIAEKKGLSYQTYIKSVIHEAIKKETRREQ
jgi:predicted DNA binding CopG/RHH family protein